MDDHASHSPTSSVPRPRPQAACNSVPERFVARRPTPGGPGWEVLVKWTGLGYEQTTWEVGGEGAPAHGVIHSAGGFESGT